MQKILLIEDESNIRELIDYNLKREGYDCIFAEDGESGLRQARREKPDLILLDIMLPGPDGYEVLKTLRREGDAVPVIMLTARNDEIDKVLGLEFGADDYLSKPFGIRELKARIKAVLRRYETGGALRNDAASGATGPEAPRQLACAESRQKWGPLVVEGLSIDPARYEVHLDGKSVDLTLKEFQLLTALAENRGRVLSRSQLLDLVWGYDYVGETRTVDVHIRYLRRKLGEPEGEGRYIRTIRGVGYKMP